MALATTCPACSTSFKVNPEQLKLRRGLVRCGKCDHVFSGVEYLRYVSDARTDAELNEEEESDDRRRRDRRGTGRRLWGNEEPSATDELKTAFFLPDTVLGPGESATEGLGNEVLGTPGKTGTDEPTEAAGPAPAFQEAPKDSPAEPAKKTRSGTSADDSKSETGDETGDDKDRDDKDGENQSGTDEASSEQDQAAAGKRTRRGSARGKRGRGRRKRAAARTLAEQEADKGTEATNHDNDAAGADTSKQVTDTANKADEASDTSSLSAKAPGPDKTKTSERKQPLQSEPAFKADSPKPSPFSSRSQTRAGAVITSPLTKGARSDFQKAGRDEDWSTAPVWPQIDEHFDEPDIEEPDTRPGPLGADSNETGTSDKSSKKTGPALTEAESIALGVTHDMSIASGIPHEEDAIDFFGKTSRPSFDFDLPPRQVLIIAGGLVLLLLLQLAIGNRDVLASKFPAFNSGLAAISAPLGLKVQLPMNREEIKIASFDLTAASSREPDASYVMNLLMRNNARHKLRWPAIELTLLDGVGGILVRKVLMPAEYLADGALVIDGLAGSSEQPIRVALKSSTDAPVGYSVSLFYP